MMKKNYRVLHIFSSYGGGISSLILNLAENKSDDFIFDIMAFAYKDADVFLERIRKAGGEAYQMPRPRIDGYTKFKSYVDEIFSKNTYDAIHCHITGWHALPFIGSAKKFGIKNFVFHAHTTSYDSRIDRIPFVQFWDKYINYKYSSAYMTCSDLAANYIYGKEYLKKREAHLIPNGINEAVFTDRLSDTKRAEYYREFSIPDGAFVIGHIGRFSYPKNHQFMLEIMKKLKKKKVDFVFVMVGDGEMLDSVKEKALLYGLSNNIRFLGRRADISGLLQFFDCMILPSFYEGLPTVAVECQAAGTQMLVSDTVTRQCDMKLGLLKFLSIDDESLWADELERVFSVRHSDISECLSQIKRLGFTAKESGELYCNILRDLINALLDN